MLRGVSVFARRLLSPAVPLLRSRAGAFRAMSAPGVAPLAPVAAFSKEQFNVTLPLMALRVPIKAMGGVLQRLKASACLLSRPKLAHVVDGDEPKQSKLVLLKEDINDAELSNLPVSVRDYALQQGAAPVRHELKLTYEQFSTDHILRQLLPAHITVPSGFETIGHIAHLNLSDEQMPFKEVIGQVILDKNPIIQTVVTKVGQIENEYRVFNMEVMAGPATFETEAYWNSRLQTEHYRLVKLFNKKDNICDMFCGVGPFVIPAAKLGCRVWANDLNPESYKWLLHNKQSNKIGANLHTFNMDARAFIRHIAGKQREGSVPPFHHVIMNLPAMSIEFLDVFRGLYAPASSSSSSSPASDATLAALHSAPPIIHCLCFADSSVDAVQDAVRRIDAVLGTTLPAPSATSYSVLAGPISNSKKPVVPMSGAHLPTPAAIQVHYIRNVAPKKDMLCVSFCLPSAVLSGSGSGAAAEPAPMPAEPSSAESASAAGKRKLSDTTTDSSVGAAGEEEEIRKKNKQDAGE